MADVRSNTAPLEFDRLTKKQKRLVRRLAWESLKGEAQFIVVVPWGVGCLGALLGSFAGMFLGRLAFPGHLVLCFVICAVMGTGTGAWIGWLWLEREYRPHFKNIIRENEHKISQVV
jgi:hypothetical protein